MLPILLLQFTRIVFDPLATALHWLLCLGWIAVGEQLTVIAVTGVTVTEVVPVFVLSWTEAALIETVVLAVTAGAVKTPFASIVPLLEPQLTTVLNVPVPVTVAVHWLVWPDCTEVGVHETVTAVIVELLEPPPHATIPRRAIKAKIRARVRKPSPQTLPAQCPHKQMNILTINPSHEHRAAGFVSAPCAAAGCVGSSRGRQLICFCNRCGVLEFRHPIWRESMPQTPSWFPGGN
jgi:hypothetical protein